VPAGAPWSAAEALVLAAAWAAEPPWRVVVPAAARVTRPQVQVEEAEVRREQAALARVAPRLEAPGWGAVALRLPAAAVAARVEAPVAVKVPGHLGSA
jgi:hypothetical protein